EANFDHVSAPRLPGTATASTTRSGLLSAPLRLTNPAERLPRRWGELIELGVGCIEGLLRGSIRNKRRAKIEGGGATLFARRAQAHRPIHPSSSLPVISSVLILSEKSSESAPELNPRHPRPVSRADRFCRPRIRVHRRFPSLF